MRSLRSPRMLWICDTRDSLSPTVLILLLAAILPNAPFSGRAQAQARSDFSLSCSQMIDLGLDGFIALYMKKAGAPSEADLDAAYYRYYQCKRPQNDARARRISTVTLRRIAALRTLLGNLEEANLDRGSLVSGGGTIFGHTAAREVAAREEKLGGVLDDMGRPAANPSARTQCNAVLSHARAALKKLARPPRPDPLVLKLVGLTPSGFKQEYARDYAKMRRAFGQLLLLLRTLPDGAANRAAGIARFALMPVGF